jgi:hypothetical protein
MVVVRKRSDKDTPTTADEAANMVFSMLTDGDNFYELDVMSVSTGPTGGTETLAWG